MKAIFFKFILYIQAIFYSGAGVNHFWHSQTYISIMPPWLPAHLRLVQISGVIEIMLGALLLVPKSRTMAAWGIIILLIAVFPANIQMLINYERENNSNTWIAVLRLPLQILLIWMAWLFTKDPRLK